MRERGAAFAGAGAAFAGASFTSSSNIALRAGACAGAGFTSISPNTIFRFLLAFAGRSDSIRARAFAACPAWKWASPIQKSSDGAGCAA